MSKSVKVGYLMTEVGEVFGNLPFIGMLQMPFTQEYTCEDYFKLQTPLRLILVKFGLLIVNISLPFVVQASISNLGNWRAVQIPLLLIFVCSLLKIFLDRLCSGYLTELQQNLKKTISRSLFRNELLNNTRADYSDLWHHISADLDALANYHNSFLSVWYETARMIFAVCYLYYNMGNAVFVGLAIGLILMAINRKVSAYIGRLFDQLMAIKKRKLKLITFLTSQIQELKMCRLESYMYVKMRNLREEELQNLSYSKLLDAVCVCNWQVTAVLISSFTLTVFRLYIDSGATRSHVMLLINAFQMMLMPLNMLPWAVNGIARARAARDAVKKQLQTQQVIKSMVVRVEETKQCSITIKPGRISCYRGEVNLEVKGMKLKKGRIYSVSGPTGAGKSTFLKSLAGVVSSNYHCEIKGKMGYVDPTSFHLSNALGSLYNTLDIREASAQNPELRKLMICFHCLEIPLKNESSTYSGGQKLRLGLVRATMGRDVIIVDGNMNSLDQRVREYVFQQMQLLAEKQGKLFIVKEEQPLSSERIVIRGGVVKLQSATFSPNLTSLHEKQKQSYCDQYLCPMTSLFITSEEEVKLGSTNVHPSLYVNYYHSYLHLMFLVAIATLYYIRNEYQAYLVNNFQNEDFLVGLWKLVPQFIAAAIARSFLFALANLSEARRLVNRFIRNVCFEHIDDYRAKGTEAIELAYTDSCDKVGNNFPFHSNILFNNIAEFVVIVVMILLKMPILVLLPAGILLLVFYNIQRYYRLKVHHLEDMSKFCEIRSLESVNAITKGKVLIKALRGEDKYIFQFQKWMERYINVKACTSLLDRWMVQRFQLISLFLFMSIHVAVNYNFELIGSNAKTIGLIMNYVIDLADKLGYLVKAMAETEKEARCLRKMKEYGKKKKDLDMGRAMTPAVKRLVVDTATNPDQQSLNVSNLVFRYDNTTEDIIKSLNLRIAPGEKVLIRGKTGAGKTTLFKILTGLYGPNLFKSPGFISFSPQKPLLLQTTLQENIDPYHLFPEEVVAKYTARFSTRKVSQMSHAERLRVNMCRAELYGRNGVIIYDEPNQDVCQSATCLIVSHHGDYDVDRRYELKNGVLNPIIF